MGDLEKVTVRLPSETVRLLRELVDRGEFSSMAEAVNRAVDDFVDGKFTLQDRIRIVSMPEEDVVEIGSLIHGDTDSISNQIDNAVRAFVRSRM